MAIFCTQARTHDITAAILAQVVFVVNAVATARMNADSLPFLRTVPWLTGADILYSEHRISMTANLDPEETIAIKDDFDPTDLDGKGTKRKREQAMPSSSARLAETSTTPPDPENEIRLENLIE